MSAKPVRLTARQREACIAALTALGAGEQSTHEGETDWPMHVSLRDIEGALTKLVDARPLADEASPEDALRKACDALLALTPVWPDDENNEHAQAEVHAERLNEAIDLARAAVAKVAKRT